MHTCIHLLLLAGSLFPLSVFAQTPDSLLALAEEMYLSDREQEVPALLAPLLEADLSDSLSAAVAYRLGAVHLALRDLPAAKTYATRAVDLRRTRTPGDLSGRASATLLLADILEREGQARAANGYYKTAVRHFSQADPIDSVIWIRSLMKLALSSAAVNDVRTANNAALLGEELAEQRPDLSLTTRFLVYYDAAQAYSKTNNNEAAVRVITKAMELTRNERPNYFMGALNERSLLYGRMGRYAEEEADIKTLLANLGDDPYLERNRAGTYHNLATNYMRTGRYAEALVQEKKALPVFEQYGIGQVINRIQNVRGISLYHLGRYDEAIAAYDNSLRAIAGKYLDETTGRLLANADSLPDAGIVAEIYGARALARAEKGDSDLALADYEAAFAAQDLARRRVASDESRRYLSGNLRETYDNAISLCYELGKANGDPAYFRRAFAYSERAKAYSLLAALGEDRTQMTDEERALRYRIAGLERAASTDSTRRGELADAVLQLEGLQAATVNPAEALYRPETEQLMAFAREQQLHLLAYHVWAGDPYAFHVNPDGVLTMTMHSSDYDVQKWRRGLMEAAYRGKSLRSEKEQEQLEAYADGHGARLAELLPPGVLSAERICIIPDGDLTFMPFAALPVGENEFFGANREIFTAFSAGHLYQQYQQPAGEHATDLLAFAPSFSGTSGVLAVNDALRSGRVATGLRPLSNNVTEVETVADLIRNSEQLTGKAATKEAFLARTTSASVLHLSTHGAVNMTDPNLSYVAFTQLSDTLDGEELLYFNELSSLPITAELVVLAACETSMGELLPGEASLSMGSAFTAAGARSTLTTLWQVDDAATKELMVHFYTALTEGHTKAKALQLAQQALIEDGEFAHPYYWSGAVLQGSNAPLPLRTGGFKWWLIGVGVGVLVVVLVLWRKLVG